MPSAYCLISAEAGAVRRVFDRVRAVAGVAEVNPTAGPYDMVARIEVDSVERLTKAVFADIRGIPGVENTTTLIVVEL